MSLLVRCPHFRGFYIQDLISYIKFGPEDVLLYIREVSSFQIVLYMEYSVMVSHKV